jgi:hypothetical protein
VTLCLHLFHECLCVTPDLSIAQFSLCWNAIQLHEMCENKSLMTLQRSVSLSVCRTVRWEMRLYVLFSIQRLLADSGGQAPLLPSQTVGSCFRGTATNVEANQDLNKFSVHSLNTRTRKLIRNWKNYHKKLQEILPRKLENWFQKVKALPKINVYFFFWCM